MTCSLLSELFHYNGRLRLKKDVGVERTLYLDSKRFCLLVLLFRWRCSVRAS